MDKPKRVSKAAHPVPKGSKSNQKESKPRKPASSNSNDLSQYRFQQDLYANIDVMKQVFKDDDTLITRFISNQKDPAIACCAVFMDGMVNTIVINENVIKPIIINQLMAKDQDLLNVIKTQVLLTNDVKESSDITEMIESISYGDTILFVQGSDKALLVNTKGWQMRSIVEPDVEKTLRGPREGFTEALMVNISLIKRRLRTNDLKFKMRAIGKRSNTKACICYIDGLADKKMLDDLNTRLDQIQIDGLLDTNYINEFIKDSPSSMFKTIGITEKPDSLVAKLLEGRIALILDGTPVVLTLPYLFIENFQSNEDYYINYYYGSIGRILRILGFFLTIAIPAIYISFVNYHWEMLPTSLSMSIAQARQGIPFPTIVEAILMLLVFELIREAGIRMPSAIGQALSIVGALVIGQAAVEAKFISAPMVIIVALTAITGLINPAIKTVVITVRFIFLLASAILGFYGFFFAIIGFLIHLLSLRSFGLDYISHILSYRPQDAKDIWIRAPWYKMFTRPEFVPHNRIRIAKSGDQNK